MLKLLLLIAMFVSATSFAAETPAPEETKPVHQRTGLDLAAMLIGAFGSKVLGIDKNLLESGIDLHELKQELKRYEAREKLARNQRIEAEMNRMPEKIDAKKLEIASSEKYRKKLKFRTTALRTLGLTAALDFFIFDNMSVDTELLRNTNPKMVSAQDVKPTTAEN